MANVFGQRLDNGSSSEGVNNDLDARRVGSSSFDLSMVHSGTIDPGEIRPVTV